MEPMAQEEGQGAGQGLYGELYTHLMVPNVSEWASYAIGGPEG